MLSLQNEVMQVNSNNRMRAHERQRRTETFVDEFTTQIEVALQAMKNLRDACVAVTEEAPQGGPPSKGVLPQVTPNPSGPPSVALSGAGTAQTESPPTGATILRLRAL